MKKTTLRSEIFTVYVEKAATFSAGLSFYIGIAKILILFDLFSNFLDWVAGIFPTLANLFRPDPFRPNPFWPDPQALCQPGPVSARPHIGWAPKPHSPTTLTWSTFNLISINYDNLWLHTLNVVEGWMWIGKKYSINNLIPHLSWFKKLSPHSYTSPHIHSWIFKTLWVIISWVWVIRKMKIWIVKRKSLNNLSVTCHGLENFPPLIPMLSYPFVNFWSPMSYYFFSLSHL